MKWRISGVMVEADRVVVPSPPPIPAVRAHLCFAESPEVHRQVGLNAIHGSGQGDSTEQQHSQDHIGHRGCDPHNLERSQKVHARKGKKNISSQRVTLPVRIPESKCRKTMAEEPQGTFPFVSNHISHSVMPTCPKIFPWEWKYIIVWRLYRFLPFQRSWLPSRDWSRAGQSPHRDRRSTASVAGQDHRYRYCPECEAPLAFGGRRNFGNRAAHVIVWGSEITITNN